MLELVTAAPLRSSLGAAASTLLHRLMPSGGPSPDATPLNVLCAEFNAAASLQIWSARGRPCRAAARRAHAPPPSPPPPPAPPRCPRPTRPQARWRVSPSSAPAPHSSVPLDASPRASCPHSRKRRLAPPPPPPPPHPRPPPHLPSLRRLPAKRASITRPSLPPTPHRSDRLGLCRAPTAKASTASSRQRGVEAPNTAEGDAGGGGAAHWINRQLIRRQS